MIFIIICYKFETDWGDDIYKYYFVIAREANMCICVIDNVWVVKIINCIVSIV